MVFDSTEFLTLIQSMNLLQEVELPTGSLFRFIFYRIILSFHQRGAVGESYPESQADMAESPSIQTTSRDFIKRLYRTRVLQTLGIYIPVAWFIAEFTSRVTESFGLPPWVAGGAMALLIAGIPFVAFLHGPFR